MSDFSFGVTFALLTLAFTEIAGAGQSERGAV
jgi:hypothetical protein